MRFTGAHVGKAIKACNPEGGRLLHHRNKIEEVREFPNVGYCDLSGQAGKLKHRGEYEACSTIISCCLQIGLGKVGHVKVFTTEGDSIVFHSSY